MLIEIQVMGNPIRARIPRPYIFGRFNRLSIKMP